MGSYIQVPADSTGKKVDTVTLSDAGSEVHRQKLVVTGGSGTAEVVAVTNANVVGAVYGLVVRHAGTANVSISTPFTVDGISQTVTVAFSTPITINNISRTAIVAGVIGLTAGTAVIGDINAISRTVQIAVSTPFTLNNISATTIVAFSTPITINNISATSIVSGNLGITGQVSVSGAINLYTTTGNPSASRGPRCIIASTSANVSLIAAPGSGMAVYVTQLAVSNASGTNSRARVGTSASIGQVTMMMAQSGGGFTMQFTPPWRLSANEALLGSVKPNVSEGIFNIHFFVASADAL
jgi:hypothetical protein